MSEWTILSSGAAGVVVEVAILTRESLSATGQCARLHHGEIYYSKLLIWKKSLSEMGHYFHSL